MAQTITIEDDYPHISENNKDWRESYYFNFVGNDHKSSGFTTIGIIPNQLKQETILAFFIQDKQIIYYKEEKLSPKNSKAIISNGVLNYNLIEPMKKWEIDFKNDDFQLNLDWKARSNPFDFGKGSETSWIGHFEQSGTVNGQAKIGNKLIPVIGFSQRDKSWGPRNWHIEKWFAFHAQFNKSSIGLRKDTINGISYISGGLSDPKQVTVSDVNFTFDLDKEKNPFNFRTDLKFSDGKTMSYNSRLVSQKSFAKFTRKFAFGSTELFEGMVIHECTATHEIGTGLIEFLFTHLKS